MNCLKATSLLSTIDLCSTLILMGTLIVLSLEPTLFVPKYINLNNYNYIHYKNTPCST